MATPSAALPASQEPPKVWFTTREAAEYLRISRDALLKHVERGNITADNVSARGKVSGHRFQRETLDGFITGSSGD